MAILLSLLSAVSYGLADFVGGVTSKRTSPWAVALVAQFGGAALILPVALAAPGSPTGADLAWGAVAGLGNGFGTAFLYRGLSSGRMGVVAPVSGVGAAMVPVAVGVLTGERPALLVWLGIALALPGIWLVAREPATGPGPLGAGLTDGILAGLGFGSLFAALAQVHEGAGLLPLALNQVVAGAVVILVALGLARPLAATREARPRRSGQRCPRCAGDRIVPGRHPPRLPDRHCGHRLALPRGDRDARGLAAARARAPRPGAGPGPLRCCRVAGGGGLTRRVHMSHD